MGGVSMQRGEIIGELSQKIQLFTASVPTGGRSLQLEYSAVRDPEKSGVCHDGWVQVSLLANYFHHMFQISVPLSKYLPPQRWV